MINRCALVISLTVAVFLTTVANHAMAQNWKQPLRVKERLLEQNILQRHNILGLYPSMVQIPPARQKMDITTATPFSDVIHAVAWTSHYLAGASYRYAWLRDNGGSPQEVEAALRRADELFEAVYRCQRVTGRRGLLARGYLIGTGPTFDERRAASHRDDWHQAHIDGYDLRFCAGPSHHIYSAAAMGMGHYYDLAATGKQKERVREAVDALVSYWVDNDYKIADYNDHRPPFSILGFTDGRTLNTRVMMAISAARIAHHVTGKDKFLRAFEDLVGRYGVRKLEQFRPGKGYDDAHHLFAHLDLLFRVEKDAELQAAYAKVADGLWQHYINEGHSHFTYIYYHLRPNAPGKEKALKAANFTLETWPTDMTIEPIMSSLDPSIQPPYPVYATGWDNEFIWKGSLLRPDSHTSRIAAQIAVSPQSPHVSAVTDPHGHLYLTHDGGASAAGWKCISDRLTSPVRGAAFGGRSRIMAVSCDNGFYFTDTGGDQWQRLPLETAEPPSAVQFDPANPRTLFAMTRQTIHRSLDYGDDLIGTAWEEVGSQLPRGIDFQFTIVPSGDERESTIHALNGSRLFSRFASSDSGWHKSQLGLGEYGESLNWLAVSPQKPDRLMFGVRLGIGGNRTVFQESPDNGRTWNHTLKHTTKAFYDGTLLELLSQFPEHDLRDVQFAPGSASVMYGLDTQGIVRVSADGKWDPKMDGLKIPRVDRLFCSPHSDRIYASTPAGIYHLKNGESKWESSHLVMQWRKNERRELGGASFITAYWRALTYGHLAK